MPAKLQWISTAGAFFRRDLRVDASYKLTFWLTACDTFLMISIFYFLGSFVDQKTVADGATFPSILVGLAVSGYMTTALFCFAQALKGQQGGTLKAVLASPLTPLRFACYSSVYPVFRASIDVLIYIAAGMLLGMSLRSANITAAMLVFGASLMAFSGIALISAAFTIAFKRSDPMMWLIGSCSWLFGGVFYPVDVLPLPLQQVAWLVPTTHALTAMRSTVLHGASVGDVWPSIVALLLFAATILPLGAAMLRQSLRTARTYGTLGHT